MSTIFSREWWDAAGSRAANTALAGAIPYVTLVLAGEQSPVDALVATALIAVASLLTSLAGLAEVAGKTIPLWKAIVSRTLKTFGQAAAVWLGTSLVWDELNWSVFAVAVGGPVLITLLRTLKDFLPETQPLVVADATKVATIPLDGSVSVIAAEAPAEPLAGEER